MKEKYRFNRLGLILARFRFQFKRKECYFCSEFIKNILDEFGGIKCAETTPVKDDKERKSSWGYGDPAPTREVFYERLESQVNALLELGDKVWGYCYTQLTDVEQEQNGIYYYDRSAKFDMKRVHAIFSKNPIKK